MDQLKAIMNLIHLSQKLKMEMRHSWLSDGRQESVAEHTWRVSLMAILVEPYLDKSVEMEKLLKMIIIHDLVEAEAGDVPAFDTMGNGKTKALKQEREERAIENIRDMIPGEVGLELYTLWHEFEAKETYEAKVANALDKLEVQIQHNEADLSTWLDVEVDMTYAMGRHVEFDSFLTKLKDLIEMEGHEKIQGRVKQ
ncbi:HD domain-containing protein [Rossellomorea marisflavi]|uniref:HD domain-containing protein n=1 Tax=Rossellomorea marisflavi TaxID=189381 RepID=UPI00345A3383